MEFKFETEKNLFILKEFKLTYPFNLQRNQTLKRKIKVTDKCLMEGCSIYKQNFNLGYIC